MLRQGMFGPRRPQVPAWKARSREFTFSDEDEAENDEDVSTTGCSSMIGTFADQARLEGLSAMDSEDGEGRIVTEENFFRGPIALQALDRQEAGVLRCTLERPRSASSLL